MQAILKRVKGDKVLWAVVLFWACVSILAVYSATRSLVWRNDQSSGFYFFKQFKELGIGIAIIFLVHRLNYAKFARWSKILYFLSIPLLLYTLFFGVELNQGSRWISIPGAGKTFQSSDLAKLAIFLYLSYQLSKKQQIIHDFKKGFLPILTPVLIICALIAFANLSTALLIGMACFMLFFIGRVKMSHLAILIFTGIIGIAAIFVASKTFDFGRAGTWENRIENFMGNGDDDSNFQVQQAKIAIANGYMLGKGPGNGEAKDILPHPYSDFIFAIVLEEYGLLGGFFLLGSYILFLWRSIYIFRRCPYAFGAFLALGLSFTLVFQALINMGVNVNLLPTTGLTLPMVSMGGTSIIFTSISIGLILSVSRYVDELEGKSSQIIANKVEKIEAKTSK